MRVATITPVFIPADATTHHPDFGKVVSGTPIVRLPHEFLPIAVCLSNIHLTTSKRSGITPELSRRAFNGMGGESRDKKDAGPRSA